MSRDRKYSSGITAGDLNSFVHETASTHGLQVEVTLRPSYTTPSLLICEVRLFDITRLSLRETLKSRQSTVKAAGEGQWANVLNLCWSVLAEYQSDPWNWTARDRARAELASQVPSERLV